MALNRSVPERETPQKNSFSKRTFYVEVSSSFHGKFLGVKLKFISFEVFSAMKNVGKPFSMA